MLMYIGLAIFYTVCIMFEKIYRKSINKKIWVFVLVTPLLILSALRAPTVGNDTFNYLRSYTTVSQESFFSHSQSRLEIGYIYYMRVIAQLGFSYLGFQVITSTLTLFSVSRFIYKYSSSIAFSFYIFMTTRMFFGTMNISRQYLAMAILLFSVELIKKRKFIKFSFLVLIATSFHSTAIVFLIVYPLSKLKLNAMTTIKLIVVGIFSGLFFDQIVQVFLSITGRYAGYLEGRYFNFEGNIAIYLSLIINFLFFVLAFSTKYWKYKDQDILKNQINTKSNLPKFKISNENIWYVFCLLTLILSIAGLNSTIIGRIESYFSIFFLAYIPSVLKSVKSRHLRVIVTLGVIVGLFASFVVVMVYRPNWTTVFPYQWYWNW